MTIHTRRLKYITLTIGDSPDEESFECQVSSWMMTNNTADGDKLFSFCYDPDDPDAGETREETEPDWVLHVEFFADWRSTGVSTWAQQHDGETAAFTLDHHPDIVAEHVRWEGRVKIKAPSTGGDARTTEKQTADWVCIGKPDFFSPDDLS